MTLTSKFDLGRVKMNQHAKYLVKKSFTVVKKSLLGHTDTQRDVHTGQAALSGVLDQ